MSENNEEKKEQKAEDKTAAQKNEAESTAKENQSSEKKADSEKKPEPAAPKTDLELANDKIADLEKQVADLTKDRDSYKDQFLRRVADFDNYRKRMIQEKQDAFDYANTNLLKDLLDSLDNFDRTVEAAKTATDAKSVADGISIINKSLVSMLENKYNLVAYGKAGEEFNPDEHEAISSVKGSVAEPVLKEVYLKGYKLKDRVIRHAKVMVTMPDGTVKAEDKKEPESKADGKSDKDSEKK
ncbi:MAG: nucleotide exchange factor GrpE [Treponema sp.]